MAKVDRDPVPVRREGRWEVDLRAWGFGWHYVLGAAEGPGALSDMQAGIACMRKLLELQRREDPGEMTFEAAARKWHARKDYTAGSLRYGVAYLEAVVRELGARPLRDFEGAKGADLLRDWRDGIKGTLAPNTVSNRLSIAGQVLRWAAEDRHWLHAMPALPPRPPKRAPIYTWIDHESFRAIRARVFSTPLSRANVARQMPNGDRLEVVIARRRTYLSWLYYTGVHTADADKLSAHHVSLDFGIYTRVNSKSARCVPDEEFEMPLPLIADLREYLAIVGREHFVPGERIGGGPWQEAAHVVGEAARVLGIAACDERDADAPPDVTPRVFRRSYARHMFSLGYSWTEVADRMGHVDTRMLREVYMRCPRHSGRAKSKWGMDGMTGAPAHAGTRVIPFTPRLAAVNEGVTKSAQDVTEDAAND